MKILMLVNKMAVRSSGGDTLIEVTVALAILSMVLAGSATVATMAFRAGQTARERTQLVEQAQEQMEALHSFRDNHSWHDFRWGDSTCGAGGNCGIENAITTNICQDPTLQTAGDRCFYMKRYPSGSPTGWVPVAGTLSNATPDPNSTQLTVPTSIMEITLSPESLTAPLSRNCAYDFELHYEFTPLGQSQLALNDIKTRLANLKYTAGTPGGCPP